MSHPRQAWATTPVILAFGRLRQEDGGELKGRSGCRASSPSTWVPWHPHSVAPGTARLFPRSPQRAAAKAAAQGSAGRRASRARDPAPGPPPRSPPRLAGGAPAAPDPRCPGPPHLASEAPGGGGMRRTPQAAAHRPTDSGSPALPAHGACAERGGGLPPILTRDCTPARWPPAAPTGRGGAPGSTFALTKGH